MLLVIDLLVDTYQLSSLASNERWTRVGLSPLAALRFAVPSSRHAICARSFRERRQLISRRPKGKLIS